MIPKILIFSLFLPCLYFNQNKCEHSIVLSSTCGTNNTITFEKKVSGNLSFNEFPTIGISIPKNDSINSYVLNKLSDNFNLFDEQMILTKFTFDLLEDTSQVQNYKSIERYRIWRKGVEIENHRITFDYNEFSYIVEYDLVGNMIYSCFIKKYKQKPYKVIETELLSVMIKGRIRSKCLENG